MNILSETTFLLDTAAGPMAVTTRTIANFDIDDYVHTITLSAAKRLQLKTLAAAADGQIARNRIPISIDNVTLGGF